MLGEVTVDEDGNWSFTPDTPLADGEHDLTVTITDPDGNTSSDTIHVIVDSTAADDTATDDDAGDTSEDAGADNSGANTGVVITDHNGNVISDGDIIADSTPTLSGGGQTPGATVVITDGDTVLGEVTVDEDGNWSFTPDTPLAEGEHDLTVTITNPDGSTSSDTISVVVDTVAPEGVDPETVSILDDNGAAITAGSTTADNTPTFSGEGLEAGTTVVIRDNGTVIAEVTVGEDGTWSYTPDEALANGEHSFTFEVVDAAGNSSGESAAIVLVIDSGSTGLVITDDNGNAINDGDIIADNMLTLSGSGQTPGATVVIRDGDTVLGEVTVDENGNWSFTPEEALADGEHELSVTITNPDGTTSRDSISLTIDTVAPDAIDIASVTMTDSDGNVIDSLTNVNQPTINGSGAEAGATVAVYDNGELIGEATVDEDGNWSLALSEALTDGEHALTFVVTDAAGNSSESSAVLALTVDTIAPEGVNTSAVVITDEAGHVVSSSDTLTDSKLTFSGSGLEAGTTVTIMDGDTVVGQTTVAEDGTWTYTAEEGLSDGAHNLTFTVSDAAGNSSTSGVLSITVAAITLMAADNVDSSATVDFSYPSTVTASEEIMDGGSLLVIGSATLDSSEILVAEGTVVDLTVTVTSSSFLSMFSGATLTLYKYNAFSGAWEEVSSDSSGSLIGLFGMGGDSASVTLTGLDAGTYKIVYTSTGLSVGSGFTLAAYQTVYTLASVGTPGDVTAATGNVITDSDSQSGTDSIPHADTTTVTAVSFTGSDGSVTTVAVTTSGTTVSGDYGTLTIYANGDYKYTPNADMDAIGKTETFSYTLTDSATGATSTANLNIQINSGNDALTVTWDESDSTANGIIDAISSDSAVANITLANTVLATTEVISDESLTSSSSITTNSVLVSEAGSIVSAVVSLTTEGWLFNETYSSNFIINATLQMYTSSGWVDVSTSTYTMLAGSYNQDTFNFTVSTNGAGTYRLVVNSTGSYTLTVNADIVVSDASAYTITDSTNVTGNILDNDTISSVYSTLYIASGNTTSDTATGDYTAVTAAGISVVGKYGTLWIYSTGDYVYVPSSEILPTDGDTDVFTYAIQSSNGDVQTATLTIYLGVSIEDAGGNTVEISTFSDTIEDATDSTDTDDTSVNTHSLAIEDSATTDSEDSSTADATTSEDSSTADVTTSEDSSTSTTGVEVDGSAGGEITFTGTAGDDVFNVYDANFVSITGADGSDTLAWHGSATLDLSAISSKVSDIEVIDLLDDGENDNVVISAQSLMDVTDDNNTLYIKGADGDTVTLNGNWEAAGSSSVDGVTYNHYTSSTSDGTVVQLYVEDDVTIG
ncbi:MAG: BapA/Bap/LapF family large adhesin [Gibbsiella quercinecans]|uniref:BapA/Bap/LapF family large adhesin n=1 Tax=Gibbsiella quercinecans TaxID=929813 RepID=UPI003F29F98B